MKPFLVLEVRPFTHGQLCALYGISDKTLTNWLKPFRDLIGERRGHFYTVVQVEIIFDKLGVPYKLEKD
jgi:hypothetical protein